MLADNPGQDTIRQLRERKASDHLEGWTFQETGEPASLLARRQGSLPLLLVAGRQIVTAEKLEVLALACDAELPERIPLGEALQLIRLKEALPVLPWGFGKWSFGRGRLVAATLERENSSDFFLGDNGGRLEIGPRPPVFARAEQLRIRVLPGSDPLPFPSHAARGGSQGFLIQGNLDPTTPSSGLKRLIRDPQLQPRPYAAGERLVPFLRNQLGMQLRRFSRDSDATHG